MGMGKTNKDVNASNLIWIFLKLILGLKRDGIWATTLQKYFHRTFMDEYSRFFICIAALFGLSMACFSK
jgi:ABC-type amino acid transport substrate-binding protein